jgi:Glycosyltransferase family 87
MTPARALARAVAAVALAALACAAPAAADDPARQPPFGGEQPPPLERPPSETAPPPGYELGAREAITLADRADAVEEELAETPDAEPVAYTRGPGRWQVVYVAGPPDDRRVVAFAIVDDATREVVEAWRDHQVETELARGYEDAVAQKVNAPYVWLPLCVLFLLPFLDRRRPFRLLHLDLAAIVALSVSLYFFNRAEITASVGLTYPVLGYVFGRMLWAGLRPPREGRGALVPVVPIRWLAVGAVLLACARIALNVADSRVIDVGVAGVIGADRIQHGEALYEGGFSPGLDLRGDVYGPANYLAYVPFELALPWEGRWDDVPAAHAAAIAFDLLTAFGLLLLGRRLRREGGTALGVALAFAWLACPWTLYTMNANANDALIAALTVGAMLALHSSPGRGAMIALAAAAKFGSAALAPLFATGTGERRWRSAAIAAIAFALVGALVFLPFLPDGGIREAYDRTLGYQAARGSPFSLWGLAPSLDFLQPLTRAGAVALAIVVAIWPARKTPVQLAALAAAVTIAVQLGATHWFYFYVVWFLPLVLVAAFAAHRDVTPGPLSRSPSAARRAAAS